ncbi:MAG: hypothetical protein K0U72_08000 [Gammaproteobacteria bacterium]|nr:hypothetical protein [Gammaproteobacteria bacterium]
MDFASEQFIVIVILGFVVFAAFSFRPSGYQGNWKKLAQRFETQRRPVSSNFPGEVIESAGYAHFDVAVDSEGLWLLYDGPQPPKAPACMLVPWGQIAYRGKSAKAYVFSIGPDKPIPLLSESELGAAVARRISTAKEVE